MSSPSILIIGTGEEAVAALELARATKQMVYGFLRTNKETGPEEIFEVPVLGHYAEKQWLTLIKDQKAGYAIAEGDGALRKQVMAKVFEATQVLPFTLQSPAALVSDLADLASGLVLLPGANVGAGARVETLCWLGQNVVLEPGVHLEAGCTLRGGVVLGQGARIGAGVHIGAGAVIYPGVSVGDKATVAAGSVVMLPVKAGKQVYDHPAQEVAPASKK